MNIPAGIIILWPGANGAIPTGFSRVTAFDNTYPKGANGANQNTTGGAATHTHTSPAHSHQLNAHQHTYTIPDISNPRNDTRASNHTGDTTDQHHIHSGVTDNNDPANSVSGTTAATYGAASNDPPYETMIFIQGDGAHAIPDNAILLSTGVIPTNYSIFAGLINKYIKGANTGADAGNTGGSYTNVHDLTHGHSASTHDHGSTTSSLAQPYTHDNTSNFYSYVFVWNHYHTFSPAAATVNVTNFAGNVTPAEVVEPLYKKILALQKATGGDLSSGLIGLWLGSIASIPAGWVLCDGASGIDYRDFHLKGATDATEVGNTGGANTHSHAAQSHSHTATGTHTHSAPSLGHAGNQDMTSGQNVTMLDNSQVHPAFNVDAVQADYGAATTTADVANNEPPYLRAHLIMFNKQYKQQQVPLTYKVRVQRNIVKSMQYTISNTKLITLPLEYVLQKINWKKIPKPDFQ